MQLVKNQILFKPFPSEEKTLSGLFVPETAREINNKGTIAIVGNGTIKKPMKLKVGQTAFRVKDWGEGIIVDNELYFIMEQDAILAIE